MYSSVKENQITNASDSLISSTGKVWKYNKASDEDLVKSLSESINVSLPIAKILINRGISDFDSAKSFFRPSLSQLHNPFLMKDMDKAVDRLHRAFVNNEKVLIYGDYDVDGTTAVSMVYGFLKQHHDNVIHYIPDRYKEGYGVSEIGVRYAAQQGVSLIISLDCGIKSIDKVALAQTLGIDFIVCDHHEPSEQLPNAVAVLDPKRKDCAYPFKELSGCGVGFKFLQAYTIQQNLENEPLFQYLDLVAISIAADIVPIINENRILTHFGLIEINKNPRPGVKAIWDLVDRKKDILVSDLVFGVSPRINAAGRIEHASNAVKLLLANTLEEAQSAAHALQVNNSTRKEIDKSITEEAIELIKQSNEINNSTTVLSQQNWHKGVIGIVASRCIEQFYRPTIIFTENQEYCIGSARSVEGFDLYAALEKCNDLIVQWGGHAYAAGLTIKKEYLTAFKAKFEQVVDASIRPEQKKASIWIDEIINFSQINLKFYNIIQQMEPFGPGNRQPIFESRGLVDTGNARILKEQHLKLAVRQDSGEVFDAIGFGMGHLYPIISKNKFDMCYQIILNEYMGKTNIQLMIKDIRPNQ